MNHTLATLREQANQAWATNDLTTIRRLLVDGVMFASLTIRQRTEVAERKFLAWKNAGRPTDLTPFRVMGICTTRLEDVLALTVDDVYELCTLDPHSRVEWLAQRIRGFGYSKAAFALACSGLGYSGCIDCRLIQKHTDLLRPHIKARADALKPGYHHYSAACALLWPDTDDPAAAQWDEWLSDMANDGRTTEHSVLLEE